jgi:hypothetical protein
MVVVLMVVVGNLSLVETARCGEILGRVCDEMGK